MRTGTPESGHRMRKKFLPLVLLLVCARVGLHAQNFSLITGREQVASLDGLWRFHTGDNPAWASPNFDDSQWPLLHSDRSWTEQGYPGYGGYAWYRFTIQVPDGSQPLGLLLPRIYTGYQVFANGKLIGGAGSTTPTRVPVFATEPQLFHLPPGSAGPQTIQIALRVWEYQPIASWVGGGTLRFGSAAGDPAFLTRRLDWLEMARAQRLVNFYAYALLATVVGLAILGLFLLRREDREYFWFAVLLLAGAVDAALLVRGYHSIRFLLFRLLDETAVAVGVMAALMFFSMVLHVRRSFWWWVACVAAVLSPLSLTPYYFQWTAVGISYAIQLMCLLPAYVWIVVVLAICTLKKDASARLLLAPAALLYGYGILNSIVGIGFELKWQRAFASLEDIPLLSHPFPLSGEDVINYIFVLALLIFLVRRFSLARQEETRLSNEMEAARSMQSLLVPATAPRTPGFKVESGYIPASEVGGDFFHVQPGDDGSLLIVVGDVSGKGLKAAITVSTIVGALRGCTLREPASVLEYLNRVLHGQIKGFVTCSAALIESDGAMTIANAGNPAPYRNGEEMAVSGGLPLGVIADGIYEETHSQLAPGDRLTFVSDGVVEATNDKRELFGFERTQAISNQPAQAIAEAAKHFGQEDDISVLSVTRTATMKTGIA